MRPSPTSAELRIIPVPTDLNFVPNDSVIEKLLASMKARKLSLLPGDILIVKHKIISKSEGRLVNLATVQPSRASRSWARKFHLDARVIEVAITEARRIVRRKRGVLITETHHGLICANSGVDVSNVDGGSSVLLLPKNPDRSAQNIHRQIKQRLGIFVPVIITDTFGRPWREGLTEVAIGVAGMKPLQDYRNRRDAHQYLLQASVEAIADELACAAGLVCGKLSRTPACIVRGFVYQKGSGTARDLIRPAANDLFR